MRVLLKPSITDDAGTKRAIVWNLREDRQLAWGLIMIAVLMLLGVFVAIQLFGAWERYEMASIRRQVVAGKMFISVTHRWVLIAVASALPLIQLALSAFMFWIMVRHGVPHFRLIKDRCGSCGYSLAGQNAIDGFRKCPECGATWKHPYTPRGVRHV